MLPVRYIRPRAPNCIEATSDTGSKAQKTAPVSLKIALRRNCSKPCGASRQTCYEYRHLRGLPMLPIKLLVPWSRLARSQLDQHYSKTTEDLLVARIRPDRRASQGTSRKKNTSKKMNAHRVRSPSVDHTHRL